MRREFIGELIEFARRDPSIVLLTGDLGFGVLEDFRDSLPNQFFNLGIAEQSLIGVAAGLAKSGYSPFVYSIGNFPTMRCMEQIRNDVVYMELPVTVVALGAGFSYGTSGYSHHLVDDLGAMRGFDIDIYSPDGPSCARKVVDRVIKKKRPAYVRLGRGGEEDPSGAVHLFDRDESEVIAQSDLLVLSLGAIAKEVDLAVDLLRRKEIRILHLTVECLSDLPKLIGLMYCCDCPIVTVEEHVMKGGFGSLVMEEISSENKFVNRIGVEKLDRSLVGSQRYLREKYRLDSVSIANSLRIILQKGNLESSP